MRKGIVLLIVALMCGCNVFASKDTVPPAIVATTPTVTLTQEQFDSLIAASAKVNQMEYVSKPDCDRMFSDYINHVGWVVGLFGVLCTVLVAIVGVAVPILMNNDTKKKIEKHEEAIKTSNGKIDSHEKMLLEYEEKIKTYEEKIKSSEASLSNYDKKLAEYGEKMTMSVQTLADYDKRLADYDKKIAESEQTMTAHESKLKEQEKVIKKISERFPESSTTVEELKEKTSASVLFIRALNEKDIDKKIDLYTQCIEKDPQLADAYNNRGLAYGNKGDNDQAIKDYDKAIELNPQYAEVYFNRGFAYSNKGDNDQAIKDYDKAIELNPKDADAYNQLCYAYLGKKDFPAALDAVNKAIALAPSDPEYLDSRADVLIVWGKYKKEHPDEYPEIDWKENIRSALSDVEKAFTMNPYEELKKMLEEKRADCKKLLEE